MSASLAAQENFILIDPDTDRSILEIGAQIDEKITPCSTFKIVLCLMGFDSGILQSEIAPAWSYQTGYSDYLESWKTDQTPRSWIKDSCVWYSQVLATRLGADTLQNYLASFAYGNQDLSGNETEAPWISSSLKISPRGQVEFLRNMLQGRLSVSKDAQQITKELLFVEELQEGWKLFGKTGTGTIHQQDSSIKVSWLVGWIEIQEKSFPFAYQVRGSWVDRSLRIQRVKELLEICRAY